jgi:hypothetical protein
MYRFHVLRSRARFRQYGGRPVPFSCFALPEMFSAVLSASGHVFIFCAPGPIFGGPEGDMTGFHVLRAGTSFWRNRRCRVLFSCFSLGLVFSATTGIRSRFHVLRSRTHFRWYQGCLFLFSCFARPDTFSTVPRASGPVFMICTTRLVFGGTEGVDSRFQVLCSQTHFRRCRVRRVPFSFFARPDSF